MGMRAGGRQNQLLPNALCVVHTHRGAPSLSNARVTNGEDKEAEVESCFYWVCYVSKRIPPKILHGCVAHAKKWSAAGAARAHVLTLPADAY